MAAGSDASTAKAKRYDRQLRIWGAHGQDALEQAHICLLNASPTGTETLKNLVLGGIAAFTVVDGGAVVPADLGNNFLVEASALGQPRAPAVTASLKELNENVAGNYVEEDPVALLAARPDFFRTFTLVVATQMREEELLRLEAATRDIGVPLLIARSYGLMGYLRISSPEHRVVESKPDSAVADLRFHAPWPQLQALAESVDLASLDDIEHKHVPYGVLLVKAVLKWRAEHGSLPANARERASFKQLLKSWQRSIDGVPLDEENFNEAINNAHKMWSPPGIPAEVRAILQDEAASSADATSDDFWVLAAALKRFVEEEGHGSLPLEGSIPDMTATTTAYLQLQRVYRERADADVAAVEAHAGRILTALGRSPTAIPHSVVRTYCKNARNLRVLRYRKLADEVGATNGHTSSRGTALREALGSEDTAQNAALYLLLRAADRFCASSGQAAGDGPGPHEEDLPALKSAAVALLAETGASPGSSTGIDDLAGEMCRFGASQLHCLGAIMGGIAAQEAIKLVTHQFVPLCGTLIYNAMSSTSSVLNF